MFPKQKATAENICTLERCPRVAPINSIPHLKSNAICIQKPEWISKKKKLDNNRHERDIKNMDNFPDRIYSN